MLAKINPLSIHSISFCCWGLPRTPIKPYLRDLLRWISNIQVPKDTESDTEEESHFVKIHHFKLNTGELERILSSSTQVEHVSFHRWDIALEPTKKFINALKDWKVIRLSFNDWTFSTKSKTHTSVKWFRELMCFHFQSQNKDSDSEITANLENKISIYAAANEFQ